MNFGRPAATAITASTLALGSIVLAGVVGCGGALSAPAAVAVAARVPPGVELPGGPRVAPRPGVAEPDRRLTPGAVFPTATAGQICRPGYARSRRDVPTSLARQVYRAYGDVRGRFTLDHLVPLELGGANVGRDPRTGRVVATANLWPEPSTGTGGATVKDRLENLLHGQVCAGRIGLRTAQSEIAGDWYGAWLAAGRP
jgi:hypothetical protein